MNGEVMKQYVYFVLKNPAEFIPSIVKTYHKYSGHFEVDSQDRDYIIVNIPGRETWTIHRDDLLTYSFYYKDPLPEELFKI